MINLILFGSFFVLLFLNVPICVSLGMSSIFAMLFSGDKLSVVPTNVYSSMAKFLLLAIPFFVLSGNIMAKAGISTRLVQFIDDCIGHRRGGIAIVCVVVACFFGAISGSGPATAAALGIILTPAMINRGGFSAAFSSAMMATASSIAIVIPPSIAFVVYASITGVSVGDMFMGGILPGIMMGLALVIIIMIEVRRKGLPPSREKATWGERWKSFRTAFWGFLMPVIILGGIYGGIFTPTEAACVSVFYALIVCIFIYRTISIKDVPQLLKDAIASYAPICFLIGLATGFGRVLTLLRAGDVVQGFLASFIDNRVAFLLILGMFMDVGAAVVILAPILLPVAKGFGIDGIHLGIVMVTNLAVGFVTPPFGMNLFVAAPLGETNVATLGKKALPFIACFIVALLMITFIPQISMCLL